MIYPLTIWKFRHSTFITGCCINIVTVIEEFKRSGKIAFGTLPKKLGIHHKGYRLISDCLEDLEYCISLGETNYETVVQQPNGRLIDVRYRIAFEEAKGGFRAFAIKINSTELTEMTKKEERVVKRMGW